MRELLDALAARDDVYLALLTGNFADGARASSSSTSISGATFACGAFAEDAPERNALLAESARARWPRAAAPTVAPADAIVIGDTPLDVSVALAGGAQSMAVATGSYDVQALRETGADVVLED